MRLALLFALSIARFTGIVRAGYRDTDWERSYADTNIRPSNITGLYYWLYGWFGSYYNGTVTLDMSVIDWTDEYDPPEDKPCDTFVHNGLTASYDAVLAITQSLEDDKNPLMFILTPWENGTNLTSFPADQDYPWGQSGNGIPFRIFSMKELPKVDYLSDEASERTWNLTTELAGPPFSYSFSIAGAQNYDPNEPSSSDSERVYFNFNHTKCDNTTAEEFLAFIALPPDHNSDYGVGKVKIPDPALKGTFDNESATLSIEGYYRASSNSYFLTGPITIIFEGNIDWDRSDQLLQGKDGPFWNRTLGFSKQLVSGVGKRVRLDRSAGSVPVLLGLAMCLLLV